MIINTNNRFTVVYCCNVFSFLNQNLAVLKFFSENNHRGLRKKYLYFLS